MSGYNSHKTGPLLQGEGMYAALHRYEKGLFLKTIAPTSGKNFIHIQLVEKIENGKRMVSVNIFTSKCLGTTPLQYWTRWER